MVTIYPQAQFDVRSRRRIEKDGSPEEYNLESRRPRSPRLAALKPQIGHGSFTSNPPVEAYVDEVTWVAPGVFVCDGRQSRGVEGSVSPSGKMISILQPMSAAGDTGLRKRAAEHV